jgi:hypothetical protein
MFAVAAHSDRIVEWAMSIERFVPCPATGHAFIGRTGLVRNLRARMSSGEWLAVIGGPKLGKTSLVRMALAGLADRRVVEIDLTANPQPQFDSPSGAIIVLDNLDCLSEPAMQALLDRLSAAETAGLVVTGSRRLRERVCPSANSLERRFRLFPLAVLLDGEMRRLSGGEVNPSLTEWTGNHPYLAKLLLHYGPDAIAAGRSQWEPFVHRLAGEIGDGLERRLLRYLIARGQPVNPTVAQADTGIRDIKPIADTLTYLGVVSRWIRNEEATLFAGCRLLNDYLTHSDTNGA